MDSPLALHNGFSVGSTQRIGDILVAHGALGRHDLESMLRTTRSRIGHALRLTGLIDGRQLARALAEQRGISHVDLEATPPVMELFSPRDMPNYLAHQFIPFAREENSLVIATNEPSEALQRFAELHYALPIRFVIITARDLARYLQARGATTATRMAQLGLRKRFRHLVADRILLTHQARGLVMLLATLAVAILLAPRTSWEVIIIACNLFYLASLALKLAFFQHGSIAQREQAKNEASLARQAAALHAGDLPTYSILVPMYRESTKVMARLIANLNTLDYPHDKLDIKLICEADDADTINALKALHPPETMEIIAVPPSRPRTKPKACNVALGRVRGEYVVIYDAEDAPAPDQLRRAVVMFRNGSKNLACLQASLNYYNRDENVLTRMFSLEYSGLFRLLLPALERLGLPIPLGGTSNHLRIEALRAAGGWDAFNVTEDADLGVRLAYFGYTTQTLTSLTLEESPITVGAWMKQRTRWIKGYIQTWLVFTRDPRELRRRLGTRGYYGFQFFIGAPALTFLLAPLFWLAFFVSLMGIFPSALSPSMQVLCSVSFVVGMLSHWLFARKSIEIEGWRHMGSAFWLYPFYWLLHSIAAARALVQLITAPHYWEKTKHGVSRLVA
jgi:cellulose synthase/poly-beta-1,6-N-acetylglucosamine synthase-like glycosyltransferase